MKAGETIKNLYTNRYHKCGTSNFEQHYIPGSFTSTENISD